MKICENVAQSPGNITSLRNILQEEEKGDSSVEDDVEGVGEEVVENVSVGGDFLSDDCAVWVTRLQCQSGGGDACNALRNASLHRSSTLKTEQLASIIFCKTYAEWLFPLQKKATCRHTCYSAIPATPATYLNYATYVVYAGFYAISSCSSYETHKQPRLREPACARLRRTTPCRPEATQALFQLRCHHRSYTSPKMHKKLAKVVSGYKDSVNHRPQLSMMPGSCSRTLFCSGEGTPDRLT